MIVTSCGYVGQKLDAFPLQPKTSSIVTYFNVKVWLCVLFLLTRPELSRLPAEMLLEEKWLKILKENLFISLNHLLSLTFPSLLEPGMDWSFLLAVRHSLSRPNVETSLSPAALKLKWFWSGICWQRPLPKILETCCQSDQTILIWWTNSLSRKTKQNKKHNLGSQSFKWEEWQTYVGSNTGGYFLSRHTKFMWTNRQKPLAERSKSLNYPLISHSGPFFGRPNFVFNGWWTLNKWAWWYAIFLL